MLKQLSPNVVDGDERYEYTWGGKKAAIVEDNKSTRKMLCHVRRKARIGTSLKPLY